MRILILVIALSSIPVSWINATRKTTPTEEPIILWPSGAPGAVGREPIDIPTLTPYFAPKEKATGAAIIVCPGGGYTHLADHEGRPVAEWLNTLGITAFVLKYRLGPRYHHPAPLQDAARAIRTVRSRAAEWKIDPKRIGILGFSAGGHVASTIGTHFDSGKPDASDPIERVSSQTRLDDSDLSGNHDERVCARRVEENVAGREPAGGLGGVAIERRTSDKG